MGDKQATGWKRRLQSPWLWVPLGLLVLVAAALLWYPPLAGGGTVPLAASQPFFAQTNGRVNVNAAGVSELSALPGIGEKKAQAIVRHREEHGLFATPQDLQAVPGIGPKTAEALAEHICFS